MRETLNLLAVDLADPDVWLDIDKQRGLAKQQKELQEHFDKIDTIANTLQHVNEWLELATSPDELAELQEELYKAEQLLDGLEFMRMFSSPADKAYAYIDIQSGSGGTEAQDWAEMLLRMYVKWCHKHQLTHAVTAVSPGEVAGIKSATLKVEADYAFGQLKSETGIHRLVRVSPFDSGKRRHTSFASVFVAPEVEEAAAVEINPADCRIDTYRSQGAGGQHVNTTDSAVRITHFPSGVVVQCQSERSQHKNRDKAMKQLQAKLHQLEIEKQMAEKQQLESSKSDIGWGSQIRSYVLDASRVKDLRTQVEHSSPQAVLNGEIDGFIKAFLLKQESS